MVNDPFETLYARYPINLPAAATVYRELPAQMLLATGRQIVSEAKTAGVASAGRLATTAARKRGEKPLFPPFGTGPTRRGFVLGTASNLMKESDNHIVVATGEVFGFSLAARSAMGLLFGGNLIGGTAYLAYEIYCLPDKISNWQNKRLMAENDLLLLHWGGVSRKCKKQFTEISEHFDLASKSPIGGWGKLSEKARIALGGPAGPHLSDREGQIWHAAHALARQKQIAVFANLAKEANEHLELATLLNRLFTAALNDPEDDRRLAAPPGYRGLIDDNRDRMFAIYAGWFRDFETKLIRYKSLFEDYAALYAWFEPADLEEFLKRRI